MALTAEQVDKIRLLLASSGWNDVMKPALLGRASMAAKTLLEYPAKRSGEFKDFTEDNLRAIADANTWVATVFYNEVTVADHNRQRDELARAEDAANPTS